MPAYRDRFTEAKILFLSQLAKKKAIQNANLQKKKNKNRVNSTNLLPFHPSLSSLTSYNMKVMSAVPTLSQENVFTRLCADTASGVGCKPAACANRPMI